MPHAMMQGAAVNLPVPVSEIFDKFTILQIKEERIKDLNKRQEITNQLTIVRFKCSEVQSVLGGHTSERLRQMITELRHVNGSLWSVEESLRICERDSKFQQEFIMLARSVYKLNDERANIKRDIDVLLGSALREVKSYV